MHFAVDENLNLFFATMKGDPKTIQITNDPKVSLLILDRSGDMQGWSETELNGSMTIITDEDAKKRSASMLYLLSPIVKNLMDHKQDHILEWIAFKPHGLKFRIFGEIVQGFPPTIHIYTTEKDSLSHDISLIAKRLKVWYMASRAEFLTATALPILLGIGVAYKTQDTVHASLALITLLAGCLLHLGANLLNDYFDHLGGSDAVNVDFARPFTGGSRVIQLGLLPSTSILVSAGVATVLGLALGAYLAYHSGPALWILGIIGFTILVLYSLPRYGLASLGLGELSIGLVFGPLMALGAYYVQTGALSTLPVLASLPLAVMITLILFVNEFPDMRADAKVGKNTLVVRMGLLAASRVYLASGIVGVIALVYLIKSDVLPLVSILGMCGFLFVIWGWHNATKFLHEPKSLTPTLGATVSGHLLVGLALVLSYVTTSLETRAQWSVSVALVLGGSLFLALSLKRKMEAFNQAKQTFAK